MNIFIFSHGIYNLFALHSICQIYLTCVCTKLFLRGSILRKYFLSSSKVQNYDLNNICGNECADFSDSMIFILIITMNPIVTPICTVATLTITIHISYLKIAKLPGYSTFHFELFLTIVSWERRLTQKKSEQLISFLKHFNVFSLFLGNLKNFWGVIVWQFTQ